MTQELYELPEGWEWKQLSQIFEIARGGSPRPIKSFITNDKNGINWIKIGDVATGNKYITQTAEKIKPEGVSKSRMVYPGDFILSNSMSFGRPYIMQIEGCIHDGWLLLRPLDKSVSVDFMYQLLSSPYMYDQFKFAASGTTVKNLNSDIVRQTNAPIPPLDEQNRLVRKLDALLSRIDTAIAHLQHSLELNEQLFASSLNQAFNPLDAEVQPDGTYQLPEGWDWHGIDDVTQIGAKRGFVPDVDENGTVVFISMSDIDQDTGLNSDYERKSFEAVKSGYTKFQKDAVLLAKITPCTENNKTALVTHESGGYATTEVFPIHAKEKLLPHYLLSFLRSSIPRELLISKMEGATGRQRVPTKAVKEIMVPVCSLNEQEKANEFISAMQEKTQSNKQVLQQKLEQLQQLKASLLDSAFRGEL